MSKLKRVLDALLICVLVSLAALVVAQSKDYAPFWAIVAFRWSVSFLRFTWPISCVGYAAYLLWRISRGRIATDNLVQCAGLLVMGISLFPGVGYHGNATFVAVCSGIVLFGIGKRIEKKAAPAGFQR
jgi:cation transport ATPase